MSDQKERSISPNIRTTGLGTFGGVFVPSILTIVGIILFMRLGFVTGSAGLRDVLLIIAMANVISILTSFSLSAIATNLRVKVGGDYYVISRTLGLEFGGAIGIVLFLAQSVSIAFYCIGFGEAVNSLLSESAKFFPQLIAVLAVIFLFIFAWLGSDWATKFQYVVMVLLILALTSFIWGGILKWDTALMVKNWSAPPDGQGFWILFAIFFPAVTGFTQGVSMSGDLKDPSKSLPTGTFWAVGLSIVIYFGVALVFSATLPNTILMSNYSAMKDVAFFGPLIDAGVIAATLSSAMASFLGAPRILQSLAGDRIFPFLNPFARGIGPTNNPRRGVLASAVIALFIIGLGNLNLVASIVSMFFLISYGLLNYATYYEAKGQSPSFRPRFRFYDCKISLVGWVTCLLIILAIDAKIGLVALSILFAIYHYLKKTVEISRWADSRRSNYLQEIRQNLIAVSNTPEHPRDWQPNILAFSEQKEQKANLIKFASWINGGSGITTAVQILVGEGIGIYRKKEQLEEELKKDIKGQQAFSLVVASSDLITGITHTIQAYGIGPIKANTVLLKWFDDNSTVLNSWREERLGNILRSIFRFGCNLIVFAERNFHQILEKQSKDQSLCIIIWWWGDATSRLMLLMAYLMTRHEIWEDAAIRILATNYDADTPENRTSLQNILEDARITATLKIIVNTDLDVLAANSKDADMIFCPINFSKEQIRGPYNAEIKDLLIRLPSSIALVKAAQDIDLDAEPEEGELAQRSEILDAYNNALKRLNLANKEVDETALNLKKAQLNLDKILNKKPETIDDELKETMVKNIQMAKNLMERATRKQAKEMTKVQTATQKAIEHGFEIDQLKQIENTEKSMA